MVGRIVRILLTYTNGKLNRFSARLPNGYLMDTAVPLALTISMFPLPIPIVS